MSDTPRTYALLSGIDSFGNIPTMDDRYQRMCRHACDLERELAAEVASHAETLRMYRQARDREDALKAELAAAQADAERYRWIKRAVKMGVYQIAAIDVEREKP